MVQINWTSLAIDDLQSIYEYIARGSKKIKLRTNILKKTTQVGKQVREKKDTRFRELIEGNYRIIYKIVDEKRVDIVTVHHSSKDLVRREI